MKKRGLAVFILFMLGLTLLGTHASHATTTDYDSKIQSAKERQEAMEKKKKALNSEIAELEKEKSDVIAYVSKLDKKMESATESLNKVKSNLKKKRAELKNTEMELATIEENVKVQYDTMKKRIKYMYENGSSEYLDLIFEAKDFGDFLNRSEYIEKISAYDRNMLARFQATRDEIEKKKAAIEAKVEELTALKEEANAEREALRVLTSTKKGELEKYNKNIAVSEKQQKDFAAKAASAEAEIENLLVAKQRQIAEEERKRQQEAKASGKSDTETDNYTGTSGLRWPLKVKGRISSTFGARTSPTAGASSYHKGIDIAVAAGTPIVASGDGKVVTASYSSSAGNYVMIYHGQNTSTVYMHCSRLAVSEGTKVSKGQVIAYVGSTGISTGNHLHFGVMVNGSYVNPLSYVSQ